MSTPGSRSAIISARALKRATARSKSSPATNGHIVDLASLFPLHKPPGYYNERAKAALLRRQKTGPQDELFVDFRGAEVLLELRGSGQKLMEGPWTWQAAHEGNFLQPAGAWSEACWHSDAECDYLELELPLAGEWKLERQMLLARKDRFLLLADALLGPPGATGQASQIRHSMTLPPAGGITFAPAGPTREGAFVAGRKRYAAVLPLALPEWRAEFCPADLAADGTSLKLDQAASGGNLYAPLWIDLDPGRRRQATWRRLTVAENLKVVPRETAVGYRVQAGREQWLIYRSLGGWGNRTVLGQNYATEFVCSRFLRTGVTEEILAIEPA